MPSRRTVLRGGAAAAGLALAGCLDAGDDGTNDANDWHYDAGARFGVSTVGVATVDFGAVRAAPLPERVAREVESLDGEVGSVDAESVDAFAATAFADGPRGPAGASVVALGTFDPEAFGEELRSEGLDPVDTGRDVDRYEDGAGTAFAVREDAVVAGFSPRSDPDVDPVAAALEAADGDAPAFAERPNGETLQAELSGDVTAAVDLGGDLREEFRADVGDAPGPMGAVVGATDAFGVGATFRGETTDLTYVLVADPGELDVETVRELASAVESLEESTIEDVSVSRDGRAVVATAEADTDALLASHVGVLRANRRSRRATAPNVSLGVERTDEDRVRVVHRAGDAVEEPLVVAYEGRDRPREERWGETPITAGDAFVSRREARPDATVRVVWRSEDGSAAATLARATV